MDESQSTPALSRRPNERGAALVIALLVATILLVAGGALIQVTSMSAANAIDSTAEMQAYYGAEAGLQAALNALRGNNAPTASAMPPSMTRLTFRNAVAAASSNDCPGGLGGDPSTRARLSRYLPYSNTQTAGTRVTVGTNPTVEYDVVVSLPLGDELPFDPLVQPSRLLVQATGYGPSGATKQMNMIVSRTAFDPTVPAMMTLIGTPGGSPAMSFESGNSANHVYSSLDNATGLPSGLPAFGATNAGDAAIAATNAASNTTTAPASGVLTGASVPYYLQKPQNARDFLTAMQLDAMEQAAPSDGSPPTATYCAPPAPCIGKEHVAAAEGNPVGFTFVKGDYTMGPGAGSGLVIVTGELTTNGTTDFSGLLLVIGAGYVNRSGGGGGAFYGGNFIARVDWPVAPDTTPLASFGAPFFNFNGAGDATMQYDSEAIANALRLLPAPVRGVIEN